MTETPAPRGTLTRSDAAAYLGIGLSTLNELTQAGRLPSVSIRRRRLYRRADLDAWLESQVGA
ncbi:MAG TPA: helix-turn-helix domain-containing protein [Acidimicrobiales bacterium]|nr:helix-turn-helix domain-containing protein [Acidimicrobiales bacterium]